MPDKLSFDRNKISPLDKNPWKNQKVDDIEDHGFYTGSGPRIGIIYKNLDESEKQHHISIIENECKNILEDNNLTGINIKIKRT